MPDDYPDPPARGRSPSPQGFSSDFDWKPRPDPTQLTTDAVERSTSMYRREMGALRELLETRLDGMDLATKLLADQLAQYPARFTSEIDHKIAAAKELVSARIDSIEHTFTAHMQEIRVYRQDNQSERDRAIAALQQVVETRITDIDKATTLRIAAVRDIPDATRGEIGHLRELHQERFQSIAQQFIERDVRTTQAQRSNDDALAAALQAAKELVNAQGEASSAAAVKSETSFTKQIDQIGTIISTLEKALDARITELKERIDRGEGSSSGQQVAVAENRAQRGDSHNTVVAIVMGISALIAIISLMAFLLKK